MAGYLRERGIDTVFLAGLATDFCAAWSAVDARKFGFRAYVIEDTTRAIDTATRLVRKTLENHGARALSATACRS